MASFRAAVVTVSDGVSEGVRDDASGRAVAALLSSAGLDVAEQRVVPDERLQIASVLRELASAGVGLIVTTGGTGFGPRDVTPEATREVIERDAPGLAEMMRSAGLASTPFAALSRAVVGSVGSTLIVNLPGSEKGAVESLNAILEVLPHALTLLTGNTVHGPADASRAAPARTIEEELAARRAAGERVVLATAVRTNGNPPCKVGQKLLVSGDAAVAGTLGCAEFDDGALSDAATVLGSGQPATRVYQHELGSIEVFLEPHLPRPLLAVFSATPVGRHLVRWAQETGFDAVLFEPRAERLTAEDRATRTASNIEDLTLAGDSAAIHTDHDAPFVVETVAVLLRSPARFIGVMGSARHVGPHLEALRAQGFTDDDLARIRTPVGLDIGARTAEEIALSILAGVIADRHEKDGGWLDRHEGH
jgi:molybdenum cofactor synthesis domain-containing protein